MWPFGNPFLRGLRIQIRSMFVQRLDLQDRDAASCSELEFVINDSGSLRGRFLRRDLGRLAGLVLAQARRESVTQIRFDWMHDRMYYTVSEPEYEMVPPPAPMMQRMCRELARATGACPGQDGELSVVFADDTAEYVCRVEPGEGLLLLDRDPQPLRLRPGGLSCPAQAPPSH